MRSVEHELFPELAAVAQSGDASRRGEIVRKISDLFVTNAHTFQPAHIELFDGVLTSLVGASDIADRTSLSERISDIANAPPRLIAMLAMDDEISIAGPVLQRSIQLDDLTLRDIALSKGQPHLRAIAERPLLRPALTDIIIRRGDRDTLRSVARNQNATFSNSGYTNLVQRGLSDGVLAVTVGLRPDVPPNNLRVLLERSPEIIRRRLYDGADSTQRAMIHRAMEIISSEPDRLGRDFAAARRLILAMSHADELDEGALMRFARAHQFEETAAALAAMSGIRIETLDQLLKGDSDDPILILGKSIGLSWATVRAIMALRLGPSLNPSAPDMEDARMNFERLVPATAQRVLTFWQTRESATEQTLTA